MKRLSLIFSLLAVLFFGTGCLKDKGFEDQKYGISVPNGKAVALVQTAKSPVVVGITGQPGPVTVSGPLVTLEDVGAAPADIHVKLEYDQSIVTDAGLTPLPAGTFTSSTMDAVIPKGAKNLTDLKLTVTKTDELDPNKKYGVGYKIVSVDQGYQIAANMSKVVLGFAIKNKYDGVYTLKGNHNRVPYNYPYEVTVHLITTGPNTVIFYWPDVEDFGHPIGTGPDPVGDVSWYGNSIAPVIEFNTTTNLVTKVFNNPPNATPITLFTGAGSRISKWDSGTKAITVDWNYNNRADRAFFDDLTYVGPRP